jgi:hypothetical protein
MGAILPGIAPVPKNSSMIRAEYLRKQAEILIAMSRATFDLGMAGRLREMASELQARVPLGRACLSAWIEHRSGEQRSP